MAFISDWFDRWKSRSTSKCDDKQRKEKQFGQINRLIVFRDHDVKGRSVLFDSMQEEVPKETTSNRRKPLSDTKLLGEMMFGSAPMPQKTCTLKVHMIKSPPQLMVTKVFLQTPSSHESSGEHGSFDLYSIQIMEPSPAERSSSSTSQSINHDGLGNKPDLAGSLPLDVPMCQPNRVDSLGHWDDSGFLTSASSPSSFVMSASSPTNSVLSLSNSYNRRYQRHQMTQLEFSLSNSLPYDHSEPVPLHKRPMKIGIGIIFMLNDEDSEKNLCFQNFFFSHIMLIESYMHKLKAAIDEALVVRSRAQVCKAMDAFFSSVYSFYHAPRVPRPVWLDMMMPSVHKADLCFKFMSEFMLLAEKFDTKSTHFFLSCLVTGVLTHHLSWAPTVAPFGDTMTFNCLNTDRHSAKWLKMLARTHPYNPLWAQLGDLYGAIGFPRCLSRTVVVGRKAQVVEKIVHFLTYFIRCSELVENNELFPSLDADIVDARTLPSPCDSAVSVIGALIETPTSAASQTQFSCDRVQNSTSSSELNTAESLSPVLSKNVSEKAHTSRVHFENERVVCNSEEAKGKSVKAVVNTSFSSEISNQCDDVKACIKPSNGLIKPLILFRDMSTVCDSTLENVPVLIESTKSSDSDSCVDDSSTSVSGMIALVIVNKSAESDSPNPVTAAEECRVCQLSPREAEESVRIDRVRALGREVVEPAVRPRLHRVTLQKPQQECAVTESCKESRVAAKRPTALSSDSSSLGSIAPVDASCHSDNSSGAPVCRTLNRGNSIFDEYYDGPDACPISDILEAANRRSCCTTDVSALDEIMASNETIPDVSHIVVRTRSNTSTSSDAVDGLCISESNKKSDDVVFDASPSSSGVMFVDEHFAVVRDHLDDVPDGPSKQMLRNTIELMQDVCADHSANCENPDSDDHQHSKLLSQWSNQSSVGTVRGRQRHSSGQSNTSIQCRSTTPSDYPTGHRMSVSSCDACPVSVYERLVEIPVPSKCEAVKETPNLSHCSNIGRSLLASYCPQYQSDFVLHGTSDRSFLKGPLHCDLQMALKNPSLDEHIAEASCIVADVDNCKVELYRCKYNAPEALSIQPLVSSQLVAGIIESLHDFWKMKASAEFCLMHLEDQLQSIYLKSRMLAEYIKVHRRLFPPELAAMHGFDISDMPLLLAVAGTHSPHLLVSLTDCFSS